MQSNVNSPDWADSRKRDLTALVLSGSRRSGSLNTRLARVAGHYLNATGVDITLATLAEFDARTTTRTSRTPPAFPKPRRVCASSWSRLTPSSSCHPSTTPRCPAGSRTNGKGRLARVRHRRRGSWATTRWPVSLRYS